MNDLILGVRFFYGPTVMLRVRWGFFIGAFALGMLLVYLLEPPYQVVHKFPTPYDCPTLVYRDLAGGCYMFRAKEVPCTPDARPQPVGA